MYALIGYLIVVIFIFHRFHNMYIYYI